MTPYANTSDSLHLYIRIVRGSLVSDVVVMFLIDSCTEMSSLYVTPEGNKISVRLLERGYGLLRTD